MIVGRDGASSRPWTISSWSSNFALAALETMAVERFVAPKVRAEAEASLRLGRLKTLERMGLAEQTRVGAWTLSKDIEPTLQALGERGDILGAMSRAFSRRGQPKSR